MIMFWFSSIIILSPGFASRNNFIVLSFSLQDNIAFCIELYSISFTLATLTVFSFSFKVSYILLFIVSVLISSSVLFSISFIFPYTALSVPFIIPS